MCIKSFSHSPKVLQASCKASNGKGLLNPGTSSQSEG